MKLYFVLLSLIFLSHESLAREVYSKEDEIRLSGYQEYLGELKAAEKKRISDKSDITKEKLLQLDIQEKALLEYKKQKLHEAKTPGEGSPEFREYVREKLSEYSGKELDRKKFIETKNEKAKREKTVIALSEEHELGVDEPAARVEWAKRKFSASQGGGGGSSNYNTPATFTPPPVYSNNNPGYFDAPPPPPPIYEPYDDGGAMYPPPPPPPPPMFEDEPPF